ncbi:unnamed protein product [Triticum turgidum subsp. durum]|uniref:alanine--tRNA ligase n=1 Tax=Triticum turgidum subsp. durum TaxID=4567 RepID=A0A9R0YJ61_TRITD|nr:unnamed protein product [Triticum turgidum subsp. durum]
MGNPTKRWSGAVIRREFFKHFGELERWYSSPLILVEDFKAPLLQTAMNRFKQSFMADLPSGEGSTFSFKCLRIGDTLEDFNDTRYHSLTELLGTWHPGEHRREVILNLLEFLQEECGLGKECIYATYFAGDENFDADTECRDIMLEFLPKENVSSSTVKGSFWNVDGSGPCGPCLGIYFDCSDLAYEARDPWTRISLNHRTIPQIWSLVFVQEICQLNIL